MRVIRMVAVVLTLWPVVAEAADPRRTFVARNVCAVRTTLELLHAVPEPENSRDRFMVVAARDMFQAYVQCMFIDVDTRLYCELSSGAYATKPGEPRIMLHTPAQVERIARLGFEADDPQQNYGKIFVLAEIGFDAIARNLLEALHEGFDPPADAVVELEAPKLPIREQTTDRVAECVPTQ